MKSVDEAIDHANAVLPGVAVPDGEIDPRWQAIIAVAEFIDSEPDAVWSFAAHWGIHQDPDLQAAVATCLLEHLFEHQFERVFARTADLARANRNSCASVGGSGRPKSL